MTIHKRTRRLTVRKSTGSFTGRQWTIVALAQEFRVSRPTIYKVIRARRQEFAPRKSTNTRFQAHYGMASRRWRRLWRRRKRRWHAYNKDYPGEMIHFDTKRLPLLKGESKTYFVNLASCMPGSFLIKHRAPQRRFLGKCRNVPTRLNVRQWHGIGTSDHAFAALCTPQGIGQKFTRVKRPQTNGKAERVIKTLMDMWHERNLFDSRADRQIGLARFVNFYNTVKPHKGINNLTPYELLTDYFKLK